MKRPRKHHGANAPVLSIHFRNEFKGRSLARGRGRAKTVLENYNSAARDPVAISGGGRRRIRTLPPERGCPQPQQQRLSNAARVFRDSTPYERAAAGDSNAPARSQRPRAVAVPKCALWHGVCGLGVAPECILWQTSQQPVRR